MQVRQHLELELLLAARHRPVGCACKAGSRNNGMGLWTGPVLILHAAGLTLHVLLALLWLLHLQVTRSATQLA